MFLWLCEMSKFYVNCNCLFMWGVLVCLFVSPEREPLIHHAEMPVPMHPDIFRRMDSIGGGDHVDCVLYFYLTVACQQFNVSWSDCYAKYMGKNCFCIQCIKFWLRSQELVYCYPTILRSAIRQKSNIRRVVIDAQFFVNLPQKCKLSRLASTSKFFYYQYY